MVEAPVPVGVAAAPSAWADWINAKIAVSSIVEIPLNRDLVIKW